MTAPVSPWTGWLNWSVVLLFGPVLAFVLAEPCGFPATRETFQTIVLGEVALVCVGVLALVLARALGPLTERDVLAQSSVRVSAPAPGSVLEEFLLRPAAWNARIQAYLQGVRKEFAPPTAPEPHPGTAADWLTAPLLGPAAVSPAAESSPPSSADGLAASAGGPRSFPGRRSPSIDRTPREGSAGTPESRRRRPPSSGRIR